MKIGTRSIVFGVHQFLIHPLMLAYCWWKVYEFPWDFRLWVAFFVHDLGYVGKPNMDGPEGESHPELGARIMHRLFDSANSTKWGDFCLFHSRFYAENAGKGISPLCVPDKAVIYVTPRWLYLLQSRLSGECHEYMAHRTGNGKYVKESDGNRITPGDINEWYTKMTAKCRWYVGEHRDSSYEDYLRDYTLRPYIKRAKVA